MSFIPHLIFDTSHEVTLINISYTNFEVGKTKEIELCLFGVHIIWVWVYKD